MSARPEISAGVPNYFEWATEDANQLYLKDGQPYLLPNKKAPLTEFFNFGLRFGQPLETGEINYQFHGISESLKHLEQRYAVGDLHKTASTEDATEISERLGGEWSLLGTQTLFATTVNVWIKDS
jgi:hypothetical protein